MPRMRLEMVFSRPKSCPDLPKQRKHWGLRNANVDEISLRPAPAHVDLDALKKPHT